MERPGNSAHSLRSSSIPYNRPIMIEIMWYYYKKQTCRKQNKTEDPNVIIHYNNHLMFNKEAKTYTTASATGAGRTGCLHAEEFRFLSITLHEN